MTHRLFVKSFLLVYIQTNKKKLEIRGVNKFTEKIQNGDIINFNNIVSKTVKLVHQYPDLQSALDTWDPELICPGYTKEAIRIELEKFYSGKIIVFELE